MNSQAPIVVSGEARRDVEPDRVRWSVEVAFLGEDEKQAFDACSRQMNELCGRLQALVGSEGEITTDEVRSSPYWDSVGGRYNGFRASATVSALCPVDISGAVAAAAAEEAANRIDGPYFLVSERAEIETDLLAAALEAARAKATTLAEAAGRELGQVVSVREGRIGDVWQESHVIGDREDRVTEPRLVPRKQEVSAEVTVGFDFAD